MVWYNLHIQFLLCQNFTQGSMTSHTETTQTITETINSMDYNTGYQYSTTGSGITASGNLSPTATTNNVSINGVNSTWTGVGSKPSFTQTTPGAAFQFTETYKGPGLSNHTIIQRTTEVTASQILQVSSRSNYKWIVPLPNFGQRLLGVSLLLLVPSLMFPPKQCYEPGNSGITGTLHYEYLWGRGPMSRTHKKLYPVCHRQCLGNEAL